MIINIISCFLSLSIKNQKGALGAELEPMLAEEAKKRQRQAGKEHGRGQEKLPQKVAEAIDTKENNEARAQAAKLAGTNAHYVSDAKRVKRMEYMRYRTVTSSILLEESV